MLQIFYSDDLIIKNERDWNNYYAFFIKLAKNAKENEKLFCCNIQVNTNVKGINHICVKKYDTNNNNNEEYLFPNGDRYDGELKDEKRNGKGIYYYANGDRYDGEWKDDKRNGKGIFYCSNGDRYDGEWKDGKENGKGIYYDAYGRKK